MRKYLAIALVTLLSQNLKAQEFYMVADVMPSFGKGSYTDIMDYLNKHISYPPEAYFNSKSGEANIRFVVTDSGTITYVSPAYMNKLGFGLEKEAMKIIQGMPKWNPGVQNDTIVNVWVYLPYNYSLPKEMPYFREDQIDEKATYQGGTEAIHNFFLDSTTIKNLDGIDVQNPVLLDLHIDTTGNVLNAEVNHANKSNAVFHPMSIEIAKKLKGFKPAMYKGKAVRSKKTISIDYSAERVNIEPNEEESDSFIEIPAEFPGGSDAMIEFIAKMVEYPAEAYENDISGIVNIECIINEDGTISDVKPITPKGGLLGYGLEKEAMRVISLMPKWIPAIQDDENVSMKFIIPIFFELSTPSPKRKKKRRR